MYDFFVSVDSFSYGVNISCSSVGSQTVFPFRLEPDEFDICRRVAGAGNDHGFLLDPKVFFVDAVNELARRFARWPPKRRKESRLCPVPSTAAPARIPQPANAANFTVRDVSRFSSFADDLNRGSTSFVSMLFMV